MNSFKRATVNNVPAATAIDVHTVDSGQYEEHPLNDDLRDEIGQTYSQYTHEKSYHIDDESALPPAQRSSAYDSLANDEEAHKSAAGLTTEADHEVQSVTNAHNQLSHLLQQQQELVA